MVVSSQWAWHLQGMVTMVIIATDDGDDGDDCFDCVTYSKRSTHPYGRNVAGIMHDPGKA